MGQGTCMVAEPNPQVTTVQPIAHGPSPHFPAASTRSYPPSQQCCPQLCQGCAMAPRAHWPSCETSGRDRKPMGMPSVPACWPASHCSHNSDICGLCLQNSPPPPPPLLLWTTFTCPWGPPTFHQGLQSHRLGEHVTRYDIRNWPELGTAGKLSSPTMAILSPQGVRSPKTKRFLSGLHSGSQCTLHFPCRSQSELISAIHTQGQDVHMPILRGL